MTDEGRQQAFNLIHDISTKLSIEYGGSFEGLQKGLNEIIALSRYQFDALGNNERK